MNEHKLKAIEEWALSSMEGPQAQAEPETLVFTTHVLELVRLHRALLAHNEMLAAKLRLQEKQMEAIGAGGVSAQQITRNPS